MPSREPLPQSEMARLYWLLRRDKLTSDQVIAVGQAHQRKLRLVLVCELIVWVTSVAWTIHEVYTGEFLGALFMCVSLLYILPITRNTADDYFSTRNAVGKMEQYARQDKEEAHA